MSSFRNLVYYIQSRLLNWRRRRRRRNKTSSSLSPATPDLIRLPNVTTSTTTTTVIVNTPMMPKDHVYEEIHEENTIYYISPFDGALCRLNSNSNCEIKPTTTRRHLLVCRHFTSRNTDNEILDVPVSRQQLKPGRELKLCRQCRLSLELTSRDLNTCDLNELHVPPPESDSDSSSSSSSNSNICLYDYYCTSTRRPPAAVRHCRRIQSVYYNGLLTSMIDLSNCFQHNNSLEIYHNRLSCRATNGPHSWRLSSNNN